MKQSQRSVKLFQPQRERRGGGRGQKLYVAVMKKKRTVKICSITCHSHKHGGEAHVPVVYSLENLSKGYIKFFFRFGKLNELI